MDRAQMDAILEDAQEAMQALNRLVHKLDCCFSGFGATDVEKVHPADHDEQGDDGKMTAWQRRVMLRARSAL